MHLDSRIRVAQFLNGTVRAGAEEVALELARGLDAKRFASYLLCPQELIDAFAQDWSRIGVRAWPMKLDNPWQWPQAWQFISFLRSQKIDVLHAHMIRAALASVPLARLAGVPVVLQTCHGAEAWRTSWLKRRYFVDRRLADLSDSVVAVSQAAAEYLTGVKRIRPDKVQVIRNGRPCIQLPESSRRREIECELGIEEGDTVIGVFGRLEDQKGHTYLVEAIAQMQSVVRRLKVLFVGDGSLRNTLERQVNERGLSRTVIFTGYRGDCLDIMSTCRVVTLPSLFEGMPLVPIEAAMLGKPVVATAVPGTTEVVVDGATGVLVPPANPAALSAALIDILNNPEKLALLGKQAQARARQLFALDRQIRETESLYEQLLSRPALQQSVRNQISHAGPNYS